MRNENTITVTHLLNGQLLEDMSWKQTLLNALKKKKTVAEGAKPTTLFSVVTKALEMDYKTFIAEIYCTECRPTHYIYNKSVLAYIGLSVSPSLALVSRAA